MTLYSRKEYADAGTLCSGVSEDTNFTQFLFHAEYRYQ